ncbi:response regulator transcription factor [Streptomyces nanhaiensis]|uniref:response regulator transcription factor n=1 Tax=Streptomyces nanhaiensis TaxID=679319 RepID=UPI00399CB324
MTVHAAPLAPAGPERHRAHSGTPRAEPAAGTRMIRVLVVGDRAEVADTWVRELRRQGYTANSVDTGAKALNTHQHADFVLLDLDLPDVDGLEVCRSIRKHGDKPIIAVTTRDTELDRVLALQAGSDDCVVTSCGWREILARIEAVLRRTHPRPKPAQIISVGPLRIDGRTHEVSLRGNPVNVTAKEFQLLRVLAENAEDVVSRKELMSRVWGTSWMDSSRTIDTHVRSLRAKLGSNNWVITVRGVGYRMGHG